MRVAITEMKGCAPVVLDGVKAVLLATDDGATDSSIPVIAQGQEHRIAHLAATILASVRQKLGDRAFDAVVKHARETKITDVQDVTSSIRLTK